LSDPFFLEVTHGAYTSIPKEMGATLQATAYSPNIKERMDASTAIFDGQGRLLAQAEHIPVHLGAIPVLMKVLKDEVEALGPDDQLMVNDPYRGGTHLPDVTVIAPFYYRGERLGYVCNRAHHSDMGGPVPGSMPGKSRTLHEEGFVIPPVRIIKGGKEDEDVMALFLANTRIPHERKGDIRAQIGANYVGIRSYTEILEKVGVDGHARFCDDLIDYSRRRVLAEISSLPKGTFQAEFPLETRDGDVPLRVSITISDDGITFDLSGTDSGPAGNLSAPRPVVLSCVYYVLRTLLPKDIPLSEGVIEPITIITKEGSLLDPPVGTAVAAGNVETSQRITLLLLEAFSEALPEKIPAQSAGSMSNLIIGNERFTYYETVGGGEGASRDHDGQSGIHTHMTNTANTPVEAMEHSYPLRIRHYGFEEGSGGKGTFSGGMGLRREIEVLEDCTLSVICQSHRNAPRGRVGGSDGSPGSVQVMRGDRQVPVEPMDTVSLMAGDLVRFVTPGGGGWGSPE